MVLKRQSLEKKFFRLLNSVVAPAVRRGIGSPVFSPAGLILLETTGFKTGKVRRTPLLAVRIGRYVMVSTVRGDRSFWVKNLEKKKKVRYFLGGRAREAEAFVLSPRKKFRKSGKLPALVTAVVEQLTPLTDLGWAFVVLAPVTGGRGKHK